MPVTNTRAIYFPYCLQRLDDQTWVILDRNYKPLGSGAKEYVKYEDVPAAIRVRRILPSQARKLAHNSEVDDEGRIYLYDDGCVPTQSERNMAQYLKRLSALMKLKLKGEPT